MSWVRSAIVISLVALLAGCGVSSGSASSSSEQHGHALPSEPLPSGLYSSSVFDIVSAAVRGDDNVYDRPLRVVKPATATR